MDSARVFDLPGDRSSSLLRWGRFVSRSLERQYREAALPRDRRFLSGVTTAGVLVLLAFLPNDYRLFGPDARFVLLAFVRLSFAAAALVVLRRLLRVDSPEALDRCTRILALLLLGTFSVVLISRPPGAWGVTLSGFALGIAAYWLPLLPLPGQAAYAAAVTMLTVAHAWARASASDLTTLITMAAGLHLLGYPAALLQHVGPRRAFLALARERALSGFLQQLLDGSPNLISVADARGALLFANDAMRAAALAAGGDSNGPTAPYPPIPDEDLTHVTTRDGRVERDEHVTGIDGEPRWYHTVRVPLDRADGTVQVLSISADITDRRRHEDARQLLEAQMQHAQRLESLGVLTGGIAHDFNNLLTAIIGNAELLAITSSQDEPMRGAVDDIRAAALRGAELTQQMLAYAGRGPLRRRHVDLAAVVDGIATLLRSLTARNTVCRPDLGHAWVFGDPAQLRQVIVNLVTNASEALDGKPGEVTLCTGIREVTADDLAACVVNADLVPGRCAFIEVADTGPGMSRETMERIFDPFFTTKFTGRGLGLSAVLGIVRHHGGALRVVSTAGHGSTFTVWLPLAAAPEAAATPAGPHLAEARLSGSVLVVDDEPQVRALLARSLGAAGFSVFTADDGEQGLARLEATPAIDLVLLDVTMPRMDGWQMLSEVRARRPGLPVVMMSGYSRPEPPEAAGVDDVPPFLPKPFDPELLLKMLESALRRPQAADAGAGSLEGRERVER